MFKIIKQIFKTKKTKAFEERCFKIVDEINNVYYPVSIKRKCKNYQKALFMYNMRLGQIIYEFYKKEDEELKYICNFLAKESTEKGNYFDIKAGNFESYANEYAYLHYDSKYESIEHAIHTMGDEYKDKPYTKKQRELHSYRWKNELCTQCGSKLYMCNNNMSLFCNPFCYDKFKYDKYK